MHRAHTRSEREFLLPPGSRFPDIQIMHKTLSAEQKHAVLCLAAHSRLTCRDPADCSPSGSSIHGTFQARTLEWDAIPSSRRQSRPRGQNLRICLESKGMGGLFTMGPVALIFHPRSQTTCSTLWWGVVHRTAKSPHESPRPSQLPPGGVRSIYAESQPLVVWEPRQKCSVARGTFLRLRPAKSQLKVETESGHGPVFCCFCPWCCCDL